MPGTIPAGRTASGWHPGCSRSSDHRTPWGHGPNDGARTDDLNRSAGSPNAEHPGHIGGTAMRPGSPAHSDESGRGPRFGPQSGTRPRRRRRRGPEGSNRLVARVPSGTRPYGRPCGGPIAVAPGASAGTLIGFFNAFYQAMVALTSDIVTVHPRWTSRRTFSNVGAETCNEPRGGRAGGRQWDRHGAETTARAAATPQDCVPHAPTRKAEPCTRPTRPGCRPLRPDTHGRYPAPGMEHAMR